MSVPEAVRVRCSASGGAGVSVVAQNCEPRASQGARTAMVLSAPSLFTHAGSHVRPGMILGLGCF
eukprot:6707779-Prymnesium_polylepis.1